MAAFAESQIGVVKVAGANGQISLGEEYAGRQMLVEEREPGVWLIRTATVVPDNERWLHEPAAAASLARAFEWDRTHPSNGDNAEAFWKGPQSSMRRSDFHEAVRLDMNNAEFQDQLFALEKTVAIRRWKR